MKEYEENLKESNIKTAAQFLKRRFLFFICNIAQPYSPAP
jgi:hypothetical protein